MPIKVTVDHAKERVNAVASGIVTPDDLGFYIAERVRQGAHAYSQLIDFRNATIDMGPGESFLGVAMQKRRDAGADDVIPARTALVASKGTATYGFARQLAMQLAFGKAPIEVFTTLVDAEAWLSVKHETV